MIVLILGLMIAGVEPVTAPSAPPASQVAAPQISKGALWLEPGQTVTVRMEGAGPVLADPSALSETDAKFGGDAIRFEFKEDAANKMMLLTVKNGYGKRLKYRAEMFMPSGATAKTSICPVGGHMMTFESWPHRIARLKLTDLRFVAPSAETVCD